MARVMDENYVSRGFRVMFYMVTPNESSFQHVDEVPQYVQQATPFFICLIFLEVVLGWMKNRVPIITVSDGITSISAGMISRLPGLFMRSCELTGYIYVWDHYHLVELPWDSAWTWWLSFLGVDFCFYWMHRLAHEVAFIWAAHQVHHSSEYYNLSTALRQTITQPFTSWVFYLPMALALPPSVFAVHIQFNLIYQFWIHTELIRDLGPLEWILNTPSHHRVHHGRNLYCIDKNYGGALIIWDRLFGTFAPETEKVVYGLVSPIKTFEAVSVQVTREEVPFESSWSLASQVYVVIHFLLVLGFYHNTFEAKMALSQLTVLAMAGYILLSLTSLGFLIDQRPKAAVLETLRCVVMVMMLRYGHMKPLVTSMAMPIEAFVSLSLLFWVLQSVSQLVGIKNKSD